MDLKLTINFTLLTQIDVEQNKSLSSLTYCKESLAIERASHKDWYSSTKASMPHSVRYLYIVRKIQLSAWLAMLPNMQCGGGCLKGKSIRAI